MLCRQETEDPRKCVNEGKNVTACALEVFRGIKKHCIADFNQYVKCLEESSGTMELSMYDSADLACLIISIRTL